VRITQVHPFAVGMESKTVTPDTAGRVLSGEVLRTVEHSADYLAQIVGDEAREGERVQAGPILKLLYDAAQSVAMRHSEKRTVLLRLDRVDLTRRIRHMDLVRVEARVIEVGHSSMVIELRCFSRAPGERQFQASHVAFMTMVAVDPEGQPSRDIPRLSYESAGGPEARAMAAHRREELNERRQALEFVEQTETFRVDDVVEQDPVPRYDRLSPDETLVQVKGQLISQSGHSDGRVKGGDLLVWLDRVATYTARQFTRNRHLVTISVNDVLLKRPLLSTDRVELLARVAYVRTHTLEIAIDITVHTLGGERYGLDSMDFLILNFDASGEKKPITTGLRLEEADQDGLRRYLRARTRYTYWKSHPESHLIQSPQ
jgi:acyl-CoA hydrolase